MRTGPASIFFDPYELRGSWQRLVPHSVRAGRLTSIGSRAGNGGRNMWHPPYRDTQTAPPSHPAPQILFLIFLLIESLRGCCGNSALLLNFLSGCPN